MDYKAKCPRCGGPVEVELDGETCVTDGEWVTIRGFANCGACGETFYGTYESELKRGIALGFEFDED